MARRAHTIAWPLATALVSAAVFVGVACQKDGGVAPAFNIDPDSASILVGATIQLTARNAPGNVSWATDNSSVATVIPQTGFVQAVGRGTANISAAIASGASATARIHVTAPPTLALSAPSITFTVTLGTADPAPQTVTVSNAGDGSLSGIALGATAYGSGEPTGWLTAALSGAADPATITLSAAARGLARGTYTAIVPVTAAGVANSPQNVAVTLKVVIPPSLALSRTSVALAGIPNSTVRDSVAVTNDGDGTIAGLAAAITYTSGPKQNWLTASLSGGTPPATLALTANTTGLDTATYTATVHVSSTTAGVTAKDIAVTLVVGPGPSIAFSRATVSVAGSNGTNAPTQTVLVTNGGGGALTGLSLGAIAFTTGQPAGWMAASLDSTTAPATITLAFTTSALATGSYTATIPVASPVASNSPATLTVALTVGPPPSIAVNPASVSFAGFHSGSAPGAQAVQITNTGGGTLNGLAFSISYGSGASGWLTGTFASGTTAPTSLLLQPNTTSLANGTYTATVTVSTSIGGVASRTVSVTYTMQSFAANVLPFFSSTQSGFSFTPCTSCHSAGRQAPALDGSAATVQANLVGGGYVVPGNPSASSLICKVTNGAGCGTGMPMSGSGVNAIRAWIAAGAPP